MLKKITSKFSQKKNQEMGPLGHFVHNMSPREQKRIVMKALDESIKDQQEVMKRAGMMN